MIAVVAMIYLPVTSVAVFGGPRVRSTYRGSIIANCWADHIRHPHL
jgi:hypothetical protein